MEDRAREIELSIDKCSTKDEALKVAINAIEMYMKASKEVTGEAEKARINRKSRALMLKAEEIKKDPSELKLSEAQIETFAGWKRPHERDDASAQTLNDEILMNTSKDIDLVQDITTDCSVVASLCAATARASKGHSIGYHSAPI
ncbi:hypothetical protein DID88_009909 [Monilinia fructigena]|uniref:Calpain catalytic domain-containing protein n=1 Tax=Monilinia fructigena TaxID=38457 RepID=A0A395ILR3_9HELO|nr:hypothetical protein DID88_009909 [Monilinia fructigena]